VAFQSLTAFGERVHGETVCRVLAHGLDVPRDEADRTTAVGVFAGELVEHQLIDRIALGDDCGARFESIEERIEVSDLVGA
jgi:hypothetical protein